MKRYDIRGRVLTGSVFKTKCYECGMPTRDAAEFHPYEACEVFKRTHDSRKVLKAIEPLIRKHLGIVV